MNNSNTSLRIKKMALSSMLLAMAILLPFLTGQLQQLGQALCPMHIPVLLCGFLCGWQWGLAVGVTAPLLRSLLFGMPPMYPVAAAMAFELAAYGLFAGLLYRLLPKKLPYTYISLIAAMLAGRVIWGTVRLGMAGLGGESFPFTAFWAGAVTDAVPGIIIQLILVPVIVVALQKAGLMFDKKEPK